MAQGSRAGRGPLSRIGALLVAVVLGSATLGACSDGGVGGGGGGDRVLVLAAASLTDAFTALDGVAGQHGLDVEFSFGGSQVLVEQADQGAPADVIVVADPRLLNGDADALVFARNRLVVVAAKGSGVDDPVDLASPGVRVVLAGEGVPVGGYARAALADLGLLDAVLANVVSEEPDARAVLAKVALGEADAGIVYGTDAESAAANGRITVVGDALAGEASYAAAVGPDAPNPGAARRFLALLASQDAQRIFERFGFLPA